MDMRVKRLENLGDAKNGCSQRSLRKCKSESVD